MSRVDVSPASWLELRRGVPKQPALIGERINLTRRRLLSAPRALEA